MAFQLRLSSEVVGDTEQATASWCKRTYGRNERVTKLGKAESTKPDLADNRTPIRIAYLRFRLGKGFPFQLERIFFI